MTNFLTRALIIPIALAAILASGQGHAENPAALPFSPGETLTYNVTWSIFPAGQVVATLLGPAKDGGAGYEVKATAESKGFVSLLYNVDDEFHSFFDPHTLCSEKISKNINEGRRHKETEIKFDYAHKLAIFHELDPTHPNALAKHDEKSIPACVEDVVSAFYFLRSQPLRVGQKIELAVNDGSQTADVVAEVQGQEQVQTGLGMRAAVRVEPKIFGTLYARKGRMLIWFSDDPQHLPLRIRMMLSFGSITGTLASVTTAGEKAAPSNAPEATSP
jgi:Protein of unknown function (DUF3108)